MTAPRLVRRDRDGTTQEWREPEAPPEAEDVAPTPSSRMVLFQIPEGFTATVTLAPVQVEVRSFGTAGPEVALRSEA